MRPANLCGPVSIAGFNGSGSLPSGSLPSIEKLMSYALFEEYICECGQAVELDDDRCPLCGTTLRCKIVYKMFIMKDLGVVRPREWIWMINRS